MSEKKSVHIYNLCLRYRLCISILFLTTFTILQQGAQTPSALANDLAVSNVAITGQNGSTKTTNIAFDISWENSWRNQGNHDAVWVFAKYSTDSGSTWNHATLKGSGLNPAGFSAGTGTVVEWVASSDRKGAFLQRSVEGTGTTSVLGAQMVWDYDADGLSVSDTARVRVYGIEMVFVPTGNFYAGDNATADAAFKEGSGDTDPWHITSASSLSISNAGSNGKYYVSAGHSGESNSGSSFTISSSYPKGYNAFYAMKHEVTEGQWVSFFNSLPQAAKVTRDITSPTGKNSDGAVNRNTVAWISGSASTSRPDRAMSFLSWSDACAFADWAALRPMTELEFEKAARGKNVEPNAGEYVWGNVNITQALGISGTENGSETVTTEDANANYGSAAFSGGDGSAGPLRSGVFAKQDTSRSQAGAGFYGAMDLGGNVTERIVTVGNSEGRSFQGTHGDGQLTAAENYEGNATNTDWPGMDTFSNRGVTGAAGSGSRGGSWADGSGALRLSDRSKAALTDSSRSAAYGFRGVRTSPL
jgi:hypothetical protein